MHRDVQRQTNEETLSYAGTGPSRSPFTVRPYSGNANGKTILSFCFHAGCAQRGRTYRKISQRAVGCSNGMQSASYSMAQHGQQGTARLRSFFNHLLLLLLLRRPDLIVLLLLALAIFLRGHRRLPHHLRRFLVEAFLLAAECVRDETAPFPTWPTLAPGALVAGASVPCD